MPLSQLLRALLQQYAQKELRDQIERMGKNFDNTSEPQNSQQSQQAPRSEIGPAVSFAPCDIGIVAALQLEVNYFQDKLENKQRIQGEGFSACIGQLGTKTVSVICGGIGQASAARATEALIAGHRPKWVISAGFAGGLQPNVARHDLVLANTLVAANGERLTIDVHGTLPAPEGSKIHTGSLLTVDKIVRTPTEKQNMGKDFGALAVDMETWAVAKVCNEQQQKFLSVRVISDPVDEELPADIATMIDLKTPGKRIGRALGNIFRRPSSIKDLWRLKENAMTAASRLRTFLITLTEQLP